MLFAKRIEKIKKILVKRLKEKTILNLDDNKQLDYIAKTSAYTYINKQHILRNKPLRTFLGDVFRKVEKIHKDFYRYPEKTKEVIRILYNNNLFNNKELFIKFFLDIFEKSYTGEGVNSVSLYNKIRNRLCNYVIEATYNLFLEDDIYYILFKKRT